MVQEKGSRACGTPTARRPETQLKLSPESLGLLCIHRQRESLLADEFVHGRFGERWTAGAERLETKLVHVILESTQEFFKLIVESPSGVSGTVDRENKKKTPRNGGAGGFLRPSTRRASFPAASIDGRTDGCARARGNRRFIQKWIFRHSHSIHIQHGLYETFQKRETNDNTIVFCRLNDRRRPGGRNARAIASDGRTDGARARKGVFLRVESSCDDGATDGAFVHSFIRLFI